MTQIRKRKQVIIVSDFPQKIQAVCLAKDLDFEGLAKKCKGVSSKSIYNWYKGENQPRLTSLKAFCTGVDISDADLLKPLKEFCDAIAKKFNSDRTILYGAVKGAKRDIDSTPKGILGKARSVMTPFWVKAQYKSYFKGYWRGMQVWKKSTEHTSQSVYKSLIYFSRYDEDTNAIRCEFFPPTIDKKAKLIRPEYEGWLILLGDHRAYYVLENVIDRNQILFLTSDLPGRSDKNNINALFMTNSIFEKNKDLPSASKFLLKKIDDKRSLKKLISGNGKIPIDDISEEDKAYIVNTLDDSGLLSTQEKEPNKKLKEAGEQFAGYYYGYMKWVKSDNNRNVEESKTYYRFLVRIFPYSVIDDCVKAIITTKNYDTRKSKKKQWGYHGQVIPGAGYLYFVLYGEDRNEGEPVVVSMIVRKTSGNNANINGLLMAEPDLEIADQAFLPMSSRIFLKKVTAEEIEEKGEKGLMTAIDYIRKQDLESEEIDPDVLENKTGEYDTLSLFTTSLVR